MKQVKRSLFFITLPLCVIGSLAPITSATAQITPDNTLGADNSRVTPDVIQGIESDRIDGGATRGANLFHSFQEFNVSAGRGAYFSNPAGIANILSRVTGGNPSNILGILGVIGGNANLFLINPNGIIFGANARLDLGGSFLASTANSLILDNGLLEFSATNPQAPPLLTVNIPTGLRFRENPQPIRVQGFGHQDFNQNNELVGASGSFSNPTLAVPAGQTLALVGGNVSLEGGVLQAPGGQIELGGLAAQGTVGLNFTDNNLRGLSFPDNVARANVFLNQAAGINVITGAQDGGSITIDARNIDISGRSLLTAGVASNSGTVNTTAGDITLNATGEVKIDQSRIENNVNPESLANKSGDINITASKLSVTGAQLNASNFGTSNESSGLAGNITLNASNRIDIDNSKVTSTSQYPTAETDKFSKITIAAPQGSIYLKNNAEINATNTNTGFAGDIVISALEEVSLANSTILSQGNQGRIFIGKNNFYTQAISPNTVSLNSSSLTTSNESVKAAENETINADNISIDAKNSISLSNNSNIQTFTSRKGNAGSVRLQLENGQITLVRSNIFSTVEPGGNGNGGDITITARSVSLENGSQLQTLIGAADTENNLPAGKGDAGNVNITVDGGDVTLAGGEILSSTYGTGKAGNVNITVDGGDVTLAGGEILSEVGAEAIGDGGNIKIDILNGSLSMTGSVQLSTSTFGKGNAGNIVIDAKNGSVSLKGPDIFSTVEPGGNGNGGEIKITAKSLSVENSSQLQSGVGAADTQNNLPAGRGNAGTITIVATEDVTFAGVSPEGYRSGARSTVEDGASGDAGNIDIQARAIFIRDGASVTTRNVSSGLAGQITLNARDKIEIVGEGSRITSTSNNDNKNIFPDFISSSQINITATKGSIFLDNAEINATNSGTGLAGKIRINAGDQVSIVNGTEISSNGNDGGIFIGTSVTNPPSAIPNSVNIDNSELSTTYSNSTGLAGSIELNSRDQIFINRSTIKSDGNAGDITINARSLSLTNDATLSANSVDSVGNPAAGDITVTTIKDILLDNKASIRADTRGEKGNITLNARDLILRRNSDIRASATGSANGGDININVPRGFIIATPRQDSDIIANATGGGKGGNITITTLGLYGIAEFKRSDTNPNSNNNNTNDIDASSDFGLQGTVNINTPDVDPSQGLVELPETVIDPTQQVAQNPCQRGVGSTFVITGRGGVPSSPNQAISSDNVRVDLVQPVASTGNSNSASTKKPSTSPTVKQIVPAQGWIFNEKGEVVLTAYDPTRTGSQRNWQKPASCAVR